MKQTKLYVFTYTWIDANETDSPPPYQLMIRAHDEVSAHKIRDAFVRLTVDDYLNYTLAIIDARGCHEEGTSDGHD